MRTLFISSEGDSIPIAQRVAQEGHSVGVYIDEPNAKGMGEGIVPKLNPRGKLITNIGKKANTSLMQSLIKFKPDFIVFDMVGFGVVADGFRKLGFPVFGAGSFADALELNRVYGTKIMKFAGIDTPSTKAFKDYKEAIRYVASTGGRFVYKPSGNIDTAHTYVSTGSEDMIAMLELFASDEATEFELQQFVEGTELSCEFWFDGNKARLHNVTWEEKKFMAGNVGANTGCMGNVVLPIAKTARIVTEGIGKIEDILRKSTYRGPIDLNSILTKDKLYGLEWTARFGYDAVQALLELYKGSICDLLHGFAIGRVPHYEFHQGMAMAVRLSVPPYPNDGKPERLPIFFEPNASKHIWFSDVMKDKEDAYFCSGYDGVIGCVTAGGRSIREVKERCYHTISNIVIPDKQYRNDIGHRVDLKEVASWI